MIDAVTTLFFVLFGMGYIGLAHHYHRAFLNRYRPSGWLGHVAGMTFALTWPIPFILGSLIAFLGGPPQGLLASPFGRTVEVWDERRRRWLPAERRNAHKLQKLVGERQSQAEQLAAVRDRVRAEDEQAQTDERAAQAIFDEWQDRAGFWLQKLGEAECMPEDDLRREAAMHLAQENLDFLEQTKPVNPLVERNRKTVQLDESSAAAPIGSANPVSLSSYDDSIREIESDVVNSYAFPPPVLKSPGRLHRLEQKLDQLQGQLRRLDDLDASSNQRSLTFGGSVGPCATCGTNRFLINNLCPGCTQNLRKVQERAAHAKVVPFDHDDLLED